MKRIIYLIIGIGLLLGVYFAIPEEDYDSYDPDNSIVCTYCQGIGCQECGNTGAYRLVTNN